MILRILLCLWLAAALARAEETPATDPAPTAAAKQAYPVEVADILQHFFGILKEGNSSYGAEWLCGSNPLMSEKPDIIVKLKYVLGEFSKHCGDFTGFDSLVDKKLGDHVEYVAGLGIYKTQPAAFAFTFYNSGDGWMLQNFDLTLNVDDKIKQLVYPGAETPAPAAANSSTNSAQTSIRDPDFQ